MSKVKKTPFEGMVQPISIGGYFQVCVSFPFNGSPLSSEHRIKAITTATNLRNRGMTFKDVEDRTYLVASFSERKDADIYTAKIGETPGFDAFTHY